MGVRLPWVSGAFYPSSPESLKKSIEDSFTHSIGPGKISHQSANKRSIVSVICPHAGYVYSGPVAAHAYYHLAAEKPPQAVIILGPNHTGLGSPVSLWGEGSWETPFGKVEIHEEIAMMIFKNSDLIDFDETAHIREHSIEVQLPFLQYIYGAPKIVPICMGFQDLHTSREVGRAIATIAKDMDALILASSDLSHMETIDSARRKDLGVTERIESMNEEALQRWVISERVSMCGYGPVSAAIFASKKMGAEKGVLLSYSTSGDITGDTSTVVGYASAKITR
jgi:AmmeMemoRadiSam system protein B